MLCFFKMGWIFLYQYWDTDNNFIYILCTIFYDIKKGYSLYKNVFIIFIVSFFSLFVIFDLFVNILHFVNRLYFSLLYFSFYKTAINTVLYNKSDELDIEKTYCCINKKYHKFFIPNIKQHYMLRHQIMLYCS